MDNFVNFLTEFVVGGVGGVEGEIENVSTL